MAGRRLPTNGEARHRLVGSSLPPPCPGGGTDRDTKSFKLVTPLSLFGKKLNFMKGVQPSEEGDMWSMKLSRSRVACQPHSRPAPLRARAGAQHSIRLSTVRWHGNVILVLHGVSTDGCYAPLMSRRLGLAHSQKNTLSCIHTYFNRSFYRSHWHAEKSERGPCHDECADSEHGQVQAEARERGSISPVTNSSALNLARTTPGACVAASNASWASRAATGDASTFDTRSPHRR